MDRLKVESSNIKSIGFDKQSQTLEVEFKTKTVYVYSNVPEEFYNNLMLSGSKGAYFSKYIKNNFKYQKLSV